MFGSDTYTPKPVAFFEPTPLRMSSIAQTYPKTFPNEKRTKEPYHETYPFRTNPENIISTEDVRALYR